MEFWYRRLVREFYGKEGYYIYFSLVGMMSFIWNFKICKVIGCDDGFLVLGFERRMNYKEVRKFLEVMNMFFVIVCGNDFMSGYSCGMYEFIIYRWYISKLKNYLCGFMKWFVYWIFLLSFYVFKYFWND